MDADAFRSNLATTITWCGKRFAIDRPNESLRSDEIRPPITITSSDDLAPIQLAVNSVIDRRAALLGTIDPNRIPQVGRLFGFYPRHTLFDGVSETETNGFIDGANTPPWDSWVCMAGELLITWTPPAMIDKVQAAIVCNAEECITWVSDIEDDAFVEQIRQHQLVW